MLASQALSMLRKILESLRASISLHGDATVGGTAFTGPRRGSLQAA